MNSYHSCALYNIKKSATFDINCAELKATMSNDSNPSASAKSHVQSNPIRSATARCSGFHRSHAEYQVISDYSDTSNDESCSTGVTNPHGVLLIPRPSFERSHDARACMHTHTHTDAARAVSLRSTDTAGIPRCVKSHETGRDRRERGWKIDGTTGARGAALQRDHSYPRARAAPAESASRKSTTSPGFLNGRGEPSGAFFPLRAMIGGRWLVKLIRVKWSLNGTQIDC